MSHSSFWSQNLAHTCSAVESQQVYSYISLSPRFSCDLKYLQHSASNSEIFPPTQILHYHLTSICTNLVYLVSLLKGNEGALQEATQQLFLHLSLPGSHVLLPGMFSPTLYFSETYSSSEAQLRPHWEAYLSDGHLLFRSSMTLVSSSSSEPILILAKQICTPHCQILVRARILIVFHHVFFFPPSCDLQ